jgi:hypothetical protein
MVSKDERLKPILFFTLVFFKIRVGIGFNFIPFDKGGLKADLLGDVT